VGNISLDSANVVNDFVGSFKLFSRHSKQTVKIDLVGSWLKGVIILQIAVAGCAVMKAPFIHKPIRCGLLSQHQTAFLDFHMDVRPNSESRKIARTRKTRTA
jgi:hypothetical protein